VRGKAATVGVLAAGAVAAASVATLVYGPSHAATTAALFAAFGAPVLGASHVLAGRRARLGSLSHQFTAGITLVFGLALAAVGAVCLLMFVSARDGYLLATLLLFAGALALYASVLLARGVKRDILEVRDRLVSVGEGGRDLPPLRTGGRDEIAELAAAADRMTIQLAERERQRDASERARRDLIAAISHDLRTPLTSLQLLAQGLEDGVLDERDRRGHLEAISVHVQSMSTLVDDLFELTRLEAGDIQWSMQRVELRQLVREAVEAMRTQAAAKRIAVQARVSGDLAPARANPEKVQRVLFNLIQNAIHHTPADGSVTVAAESNGSDVTVEVADTGIGIRPEERDRVFEPFYRGDASRTDRGSGLGLTICRVIVEVHGGRIWLADSSVGTRVRFSLPAATG
jgi:signal transduction histidine kinase